MTGRKKDPIWYNFTVCEVPGKKCLRVKCKKCETEIVGLVDRMKKHYASCLKNNITGRVYESNISGNDEAEVLSDEMSDADSDSERQVKGTVHCKGTKLDAKRRKTDKPSHSNHSIRRFSSATATASSVSNASDASTSSLFSMENFLVRTTSEDMTKIDIQIAKYFYSTNTPFLHVEHTEFKKLIELLRPGYKPPNRKHIGGELLDEVYGDTVSKIKCELKGKNVCMALDGWSNIHNESVVCISATDVLDNNVYLISTIDTADNSHTGDYLLQLAVQAINQCQEFKCQVTSFVTDNASNMTNMRTQLSQHETCLGNNLDVITYGCSAHILNLLAHDIEVPGVMEHVKQIIKYFRNHHFPAAKYKQAGGKKLILPIDVRWNTAADCLESYINNWHILSKVCSENRAAFDANIISKVNNIGIKVNAQDYLVRLKKIAIALDKIQANFCTISEATHIWLLLLEEFKNMSTVDNDDAKYVKLCERRFDMALSSIHFLSYLLDPRYIGEKLSTTQLESAMEYIDTYHPIAMPDILNYRAKTSPFKEYLFKEKTIQKITPLTWWLSLRDQLQSDTMKLVTQLHSAVSSSAGVERIFSSFGIVHSKLRNRLGVEKASKLVTIFKALNKTLPKNRE